MLGENRQKRGSGLVIAENTSSESIVLLAGVDAGSTETRVSLADWKDAAIFGDSSKSQEALDILLRDFRIPSTYANVDDAREITPVSDNLEDNYDSNLTLIRNNAEKSMIGRCRVLRGRKTQDAMGLVSRYLDSSTNKTDNPIFYVNILDGLGYAILQKYNGAIPKEVDIYLTLSVRPKELTSICRKKMTENLVGTFMFIWKSVNVQLNIKDLAFTTEPEAQIGGTTTVYDLRADSGIDAVHYSAMADQLYDSHCYVHIEGGGSSIGVEVVRNGSLIDACSSTFPLGGNYMAQMFIDRYREQNGRTITKEAAGSALITCILREGRSSIDVSELVAQCKNQVGMDILERLRHEVVDTMSDLMLQDVEFITLGGRLFLPDAAGTTVGEYFGEYVHQLSPNTDVHILAENFIAQGNLVNAMNSDYGSKLKAPTVPPVQLAENLTGRHVEPAVEEDSDEE